jgi:hypothetical protein
MPENHNDKNKMNPDDKKQQRSPNKKQDGGQPREPSKSGQPDRELDDQITQRDTRP